MWGLLKKTVLISKVQNLQLLVYSSQIRKRWMLIGCYDLGNFSHSSLLHWISQCKLKITRCHISKYSLVFYGLPNPAIMLYLRILSDSDFLNNLLPQGINQVLQKEKKRQYEKKVTCSLYGIKTSSKLKEHIKNMFWYYIKKVYRSFTESRPKD